MPRPPHILVIDEDADARDLARMAVRSVYPDAHVTDAAGPVAYAEAAIQGGFDLVIVEPNVSWADRMDLVRNARRRWPRTPIAVFTASGDVHSAVDQMHAGATDIASHASAAGVLRLSRIVERLVERAPARPRERDTLPVFEPPGGEWERRLTPPRPSTPPSPAPVVVEPVATTEPQSAPEQPQRITDMLTSTRAPIRSVITHLETLRRDHGGRLDDEAFAMVRSTSESARRMLDRIDGLIGPDDAAYEANAEQPADEAPTETLPDDAAAVEHEPPPAAADGVVAPVDEPPPAPPVDDMWLRANADADPTTRDEPAPPPPPPTPDPTREAYARAANIDVIRDIIERSDAITIQPSDGVRLTDHIEAMSRAAAPPEEHHVAPDTGSFPASDEPQHAAEPTEHITLNSADVVNDTPDDDVPEPTGSVPRVEESHAQSAANNGATWALLTPQSGVPASTDAMDVLNDVIVSMADDIKRYGATITYDALPAVAMSATDLAQVLRNLIANGIRYRRDERPRVHIACRREADHDAFTVTDNGTGIAPEDRERIFEMFERAHTGNRYPGTGIGLTITRTVVEAGGGNISVESHPGHGSTFTFTVPHAPRNVPRRRAGVRRATVSGLPGTP